MTGNMPKIVLDSFVLRFPRTGIVNYVYNIAHELMERPGYDTTLVLQDLNASDPEIGAFINKAQTRIFNPNAYLGISGRISRKFNDPKLVVELPWRRSIDFAVNNSEIYHATDWYHYPSRHAQLNVITVFDITTTLYPQFHEHTNIVKEQRKAKSLRHFDHIVAISDATRNDIINHFGVDESKITTSHLGVDAIYERPRIKAKEAFLPKYGIPVDRPYILSERTSWAY
jgi:glycosyltransferase involved in cell wall biosynthesis